jgi:pimeloyl-ACP methyl ester carboxylesterase
VREALWEARRTRDLSPLIADRERARTLFWTVRESGTTQSRLARSAEVKAYAGQLQNESLWAFLDTDLPLRARPRRGEIPFLVLGAEQDAIFTPEEIYTTGRVYRADLQMFQRTGHDMMLEEDWESVARWILQWLEYQGCSPARGAAR